MRGVRLGSQVVSSVTRSQSFCRVCVGVAMWVLFRVVVGWGLADGAGADVVASAVSGRYPAGLWRRGLVVGLAPASVQNLSSLDGVEDLTACVARPAVCR